MIKIMRRWDVSCFVFINIYGFILIGVMRMVKKEMTMASANMLGNRRGLTGHIKYYCGWKTTFTLSVRTSSHTVQTPIGENYKDS